MTFAVGRIKMHTDNMTRVLS